MSTGKEEDIKVTVRLKQVQELVDMMHYRPFFREVDFHLHNFDFHANNYFAEPKFRPPELLCLLNDLQAKLCKSLISSVKKYSRQAHSITLLMFASLTCW